MQRRRLVEGLVEACQRVEEEAGEPAAVIGPVEGEAQRESEKAGDGDDLRREQAFPVRIELGAVWRRRRATGRRAR